MRHFLPFASHTLHAFERSPAGPSAQARAWLAFLVLVLLSGCTRADSERQAETQKDDHVTVSGSATVPGLGDVPIVFQINRTGTESLQEQAITRTQIDAEAIAQQVGAVVSKSFDAAMSKITGLSGGGFTPTEGGAMATAAGLAGWGLQEMLKRRREQQALLEVKAARNKAQEQNVELAKQIPVA